MQRRQQEGGTCGVGVSRPLGLAADGAALAPSIRERSGVLSTRAKGGLERRPEAQLAAGGSCCRWSLAAEPPLAAPRFSLSLITAVPVIEAPRRASGGALRRSQLPRSGLAVRLDGKAYLECTDAGLAAPKSVKKPEWWESLRWQMRWQKLECTV